MLCKIIKRNKTYCNVRSQHYLDIQKNMQMCITIS